MITLTLAALALILLVAFLVKELWRPANYPPGPRWLPIVGNTPLIRRMASQHGGLLANVFDKLSESYQSSVIGLKLGRERVVVGLGYDEVKGHSLQRAFQGPPWLPIVGNTPYIRKLARQYGGQHKVFELLGKTYRSDVIGLKLGRENMAVALNYPATTSATLDLALMMMIVHPDVQDKVHREIDSQLEPNAIPHYDDRLKLPYVEAFLLEVQRFFSIVPVNGPRRAVADCTLGGYRVPKDTTVLMGLRNVHMDPDHWGDPEVFRPERFLNEQRQIVNTERLLPFGQGKRRCLGETLARSCLFTFFVGVMKRFCLVGTDEASEDGTSMAPSLTLKPGITLSAKPYHVVFQPRKRT
uniref:Cytochrome P450 n=1 Tax=Anopheles coluzzii TaxID=1518534 RepID=A0A8W7PWE0_ANOCL